MKQDFFRLVLGDWFLSAGEFFGKGEVGGAGDEADFAGADRHADGVEECEVGLGDVVRIVKIVRDFRRVGVEARVAEFD